MSTNRVVSGENRFYIPPPMRKLQQEREKKIKRLEAEEEKMKAKKLSENLSITQSSPIPADILIDILSRVPAKSIGRFRCVSKLWKSILHRPDFTELFLTRSSTHPRLFFTLKVNKELLVFSSPQPQNPNNNSSLVATRYKSFPKHFPNGVLEICNSLCGFFFLQSWMKKQRVICNPVTGEFIALRFLPKVLPKYVRKNYFGFDPINKQFKVLSITRSRYGTPNTHWVLTLGTRKRKWRTIQDPLFPHNPARNGICINGVLYYIANFEGSYKIVCFDFRFEKFSIIKMDEDMLINHVYGSNPLLALNLFNNKGKLGVYKYKELSNEALALWVLEDAGKHKWSSKRVCVLPLFWNNTVKNQGYKIVGVTGTGEFVFTPYLLSNPFYIFYYNIERNTFTRVNIQGFEEFYLGRPAILTFLDYVESVQGFIT